MQHNNVAVPSVPPRTLFKDLRFSEEEYGRLSAARRSGTFLSSPSTVDEDSPKVRVTGTSDDVKALLNIASGHAQRCWIEVPFSTMDSLLWVMERVEKVIRVPMKYWTLAGDGVMYNPGHLVASLDHFRQPGTIEVVLLPVWEIGRYAEENLKSHTWKHAPVTPPAALPKDPREQAMALFGLIDPVESPDWAAYIKHRQEAEKVTNDLMEGMAGADMDPFVSQLREVVQDVAEAVNPLMDDDWKKIADSVSVIRCVPEDDGWGRLRDVEVLSRIHSLASPQSVDV
ncbi:hypothetical protein SCP_1203960 [Sparassis crispa]|uniref:Uncharacterized protein n=1 Tax=Sparassis crispa TaxID=139825 RepID=A0A401H152_9APHY|nr:hypothetical protein SCP_1203960 [Sparassis crispa]GBE88166.1 hypothetical protein SCP_1203960 [Sparassis crispa]